LTETLRNWEQVIPFFAFAPEVRKIRLIAEPDTRRFSGSPPEAKIASARRHHS